MNISTEASNSSQISVNSIPGMIQSPDGRSLLLTYSPPGMPGVQAKNLLKHPAMKALLKEAEKDPKIVAKLERGEIPKVST